MSHSEWTRDTRLERVLERRAVQPFDDAPGDDEADSAVVELRAGRRDGIRTASDGTGAARERRGGVTFTSGGGQSRRVREQLPHRDVALRAAELRQVPRHRIVEVETA